MADTKNTLEVDNLLQLRTELDAARVRYADFYDFAPAAHLTINQEGEILEVNIKASELLGVGRAQLIGQKFSRYVAPEAHDALNLLYRISYNSLAKQGAEFELVNAQAGRLVVLVEAARDTTNPQKQCRLSMVDITESKRAKETLRKNEERYRALFASSRDAIMTLEPPAWNFTSGNPASVEMFRAGNEGRFVSTSPWELSPEFQPDGRPSNEAALAMIETAMRLGSHFFEWSHRRLDGEEFPATVLLTRVELEGSRFLQATVRDITEQKRAEIRMARLARARSILSGIDHAIIHIHDRQKLLDEICRVAVEKGGFKLAWIGMVTPDGVVQPVAQAGATGYLECIPAVVTSDKPEGRGPVGTAIRENRIAVVNDISQDENTLPWREPARKYGLRYVAAFPIRVGQKVTGSFQVYAESASLFDASDFDFLTELADDISFALTAMADFQARTQAEEQLRKLSLAVEQSPVSIVITDITGAIEYVNPRFTELTGYTTDEVLGKNPRLLKSGELPVEEYQRLWQTITQGREWRGQFHNRKKNGELFWEAASISPVKDADGKISHFLAVKEDITERKLFEMALQESEQRFHQLANATYEGICISEEGTICDVNDQLLKMFGCERDEMVGKHILNFVAPDSRTAVADAIRNDQEEIYEHQARRKDGTVFYVEIQAKKMRIGDRQARVTAVRDITGRKQAEEALRRSQERYVMAERATNDGLWDWNIQTDEDYFSPRWKEILGYREDELPNHKSTFFNHLHPDDRVAVDAVTQRHLEKGERYALEFRLRHKDGSYRWVYSRGEAQRDTAGRPVRMVGGVTDITERKRLEAEIFDERERLEREVLRRIELDQERIGQDLHDGLCQILVGAKFRIGALEKMLTDNNLSSATAEAKVVEGMLNQTIQQARDLAKGLNPVVLHQKGLVIALEELAKEVGNMAVVHCHCRCNPATAISDVNAVNHLYRITQEAVQNAIKHGKAKNISIALNEQAGDLVLLVDDDGTGFSNDAQKLIGAGLHNMKTRAETIGGTLEIQPSQSGGTLISVRLPLKTKQR